LKRTLRPVGQQSSFTIWKTKFYRSLESGAFMSSSKLGQEFEIRREDSGLEI
jgi:hypothetical protein